MVRADRQTSGRGRRGRTWDSPEGGLYASVSFDPPGANSVSLVPLAAAQCLRTLLIEDHSVSGLEVKWPNDLLLNDRKLAGFLGESGGGRVYLGMGVNLVEQPPGSSSYRRSPAALSDVLASPPPPVRLLESWWERFSGWLSSPGAYFDARFLQDSLRPIGRSVKWNGGRGRAVSLAADGGLVIEQNGDSRTLYATEVEELTIDEAAD